VEPVALPVIGGPGSRLVQALINSYAQFSFVYDLIIIGTILTIALGETAYRTKFLGGDQKASRKLGVVIALVLTFLVTLYIHQRGFKVADLTPLILVFAIGLASWALWKWAIHPGIRQLNKDQDNYLLSISLAIFLFLLLINAMAGSRLLDATPFLTDLFIILYMIASILLAIALVMLAVNHVQLSSGSASIERVDDRVEHATTPTRHDAENLERRAEEAQEEAEHAAAETEAMQNEARDTKKIVTDAGKAAATGDAEAAKEAADKLNEQAKKHEGRAADAAKALGRCKRAITNARDETEDALRRNDRLARELDYYKNLAVRQLEKKEDQDKAVGLVSEAEAKLKEAREALEKYLAAIDAARQDLATVPDLGQELEAMRAAQKRFAADPSKENAAALEQAFAALAARMEARETAIARLLEKIELLRKAAAEFRKLRAAMEAAAKEASGFLNERLGGKGPLVTLIQKLVVVEKLLDRLAQASGILQQKADQAEKALQKKDDRKAAAAIAERLKAFVHDELHPGIDALYTALRVVEAKAPDIAEGVRKPINQLQREGRDESGLCGKATQLVATFAEYERKRKDLDAAGVQALKRQILAVTAGAASVVGIAETLRAFREGLARQAP
jgi:hypothetical protein